MQLPWPRPPKARCRFPSLTRSICHPKWDFHYREAFAVADAAAVAAERPLLEAPCCLVNANLLACPDSLHELASLTPPLCSAGRCLREPPTVALPVSPMAQLWRSLVRSFALLAAKTYQSPNIIIISLNINISHYLFSPQPFVLSKS